MNNKLPVIKLFEEIDENSRHFNRDFRPISDSEFIKALLHIL